MTMNNKKHLSIKAAIDTISISEACHEANRILCEACGHDPIPSWSEAPDWMIESTIDGVLFLIDNPDAKVNVIHDKWMSDKIKAGWSYGEVKDPEKKTHPCIVPFEMLPVDQQAKDKMFSLIVRSMMKMKEK